MSHDCPRTECGESFPNNIKKERHLAEDHEAPWEVYDGYPRPPNAR